MKKTIVTIAALFFTSISYAQSLEDITWVTEDYPPFNYSENGAAAGISVDVLLEIWKRAGLNKTVADIKIWPWSRGYEMTKKKVGLCLFSMTITDSRKEFFKFVGPIPAGSGNTIIAKKSKELKLNSIDDLKKLKIGIILKDVGEQLLVDAGIDKNTLDQCVDPACLLKKLDAGRVDAISYGYETAVYKMKELGIDHTKFENVYTLSESNMGYAFHKDTDPSIIEKLQAILDEINADGTGKKIQSKYQ
ncbi:Extracellular solute-binding protein family 3 [Desulfamplus magnetovallimortis]|uniref:Extracellular solute-binding protein family 3 n=1 Tax=Desulfamplus magnetovallimortis TaxID=1246637 RepID=A0A1W1HJ42_9BACT|nr:transporter substrate-binding domain-containing protein [Desulfamplus magnetovallimortis]SLM32474.1 Extracellular solute-binding protein family 3 [Desulfamplus magnetovallimortis]